MAKKQTDKKNRNNKVADNVDLSLPQNIVLFGEQNPEDKKIYIAQDVYKEIHRFTKDKTKNESGGVILGNVIEEFGKTHIVIRAFIEAKYCEGTPTTLKFTHESWEYIHSEAAKKYPKYKIVGWIHTHPDFGIFLSEYDKFIQENFFNEENQIAYVVDPIQNIEGFYFWINGNIERCKGFFLFDKTGVKISVEKEEEVKVKEETKASNSSSNSKILTIIIAIMGVAIVALIILCFSLHSKVNTLQNQQMALVDSANKSISSMGTEIQSIKRDVGGLTSRIEALEPTTEPETTEQSEDVAPENESSESDTSSTVEATTEDSSEQGAKNTQPSTESATGENNE